MRLTSAGAARTVTGSCHLLEVDGAKILVDCGLFQGGAELQARNRSPFPFDPSDLDAVVLTHGHLDHVGRLPLLVSAGYRGPIYCPAATNEVAAIILRDSAKIHEEDAERELRKARRAGREDEVEGPLYTLADAERAIDLLRSVPMDETFTVAGHVRITPRSAGHILGSAYLVVDDGHARWVFSGDLGNRESALQAPATPPEACDVMLLETTYADRNHRPRAATEAEFEEVLHRALARGGNVLIPTFAVERSQQVLYQLFRMTRNGRLPHLPVYLDAPMATRMTRLYQSSANEFRPEVRELLENGTDPFEPPGLEYTVTPDASREINDIEGGAVIVAGSGMMTGGRILHHLKHNLWREEASLVVVGYQARGTLGRAIVEGAQRVRILGDEIAVRASVHTIGGFSAHADHDDLLRFLEPSRPEHVLLVHGEPDVMDTFADDLRGRGYRVDMPELDTPMTL
ncbi:MAG: MBL fold metallo-hydrolase [Trueperaceae bacterium]